MATLNELKTQIVNANALGKAKIAGKGGTVAQDADTVAIMNAIDSIPAGGGGAAPTIVNEITWDGTGDPVEIEGGTLYKISDNVLPYNIMIDASAEAYLSGYSYTADISNGATETHVDNIILGNNVSMIGVSDNGMVICATATVINMMGSTTTLPSTGTYGMKVDGKWLTRITATAAAGE